MATKELGPRKGVKPNTKGVPGQFCEIDGLPLVFGGRLRVSPYDALLKELVEKTEAAVAAGRPRPGLVFEDRRCRPSLCARSKKLNLIISFAEHDGKTYVRFDGRTAEEIRSSRKVCILKLAGSIGPVSAVSCATKLRESGDTTIDAALAALVMNQMVRDGSLVQQDGGYYAINPKHKSKAA